MYHQVDVHCSDQEQRFCTLPGEFRRQMAWLKASRYRSVSLEDIVTHVSSASPLTGKAVHITFDDGFIGVLEHALPALKEQKYHATLFAVPGLAGGTNDWMWRQNFPRRALLSPAHLRLLAEEGMTIGSHTRTHAPLSEISLREAQAEIAGSKAELEDILDQEVAHFAYPYGLFNATVRALVADAGYRSGCSIRSGFNQPGEDCFLLRRIEISGSDRLWQFRQKLHYGASYTRRLRYLTYYAKRAASRLGLG